MKDEKDPPAPQTLKGKFRIHVALVTVIAFLLIISAGSIIVLNYTQTSEAYMDDAIDDLSRTRLLVSAQIKGFFIPTHKFLLILKRMLDEDKDLTSNKTFQSATMSMLDTFARFKTLGFGDEEGNAVVVSAVFPGSKWKSIALKYKVQNARFIVRVVKNTNGIYSDEIHYFNNIMDYISTVTPSFEDIEKYNPEERPWFKKAVEKQQGIWTDLYAFSNGVEGISTSYPLYEKNGKLKVVLFADVTLGIIRNFLSLLPLGQHGFGAIITTDGKVIVESDSKKACAFCKNKFNTSPSQVVHEAFKYGMSQSYLDDPFLFKHHNKTLLCEFSSFDKVFSNNWRLALILPEEDYIGHIKSSTIRVTIFSICILVISIILIYVLSKIITKPILALSSDMKKIQNFDIDPSHSIKSFLYEICLMSNTLLKMKNSLQTFGYYVPKNLVRQLIKKGIQAKLGGEKRNLTILFTDVYDFTQISETQVVDDLIHQTSNYLEKISIEIDKYHGTIDKFIGDGVMAFWGAPEHLDNHIGYACEAALACRYEVNQLNSTWSEQGKPIFQTRFALNSGETIVGNLGSHLRMNYTAFGDTVNVCSRLESLNKIYGTDIIVGESVYNEVSYLFLFRLLDFISVKGKIQGLKIYELMSRKSTSDPKDIEMANLSDEAFNMYAQRKWDEAKELYEKLALMNSGDKVAEIFLDRIASYRKTPPDEDWKGLTIMYHK